MSARWDHEVETDNAGKPFHVWRWEGYELSENVNLGDEGGWVFELELGGKRVALCPSLKEGKERAARHREELAHAAAAPVDSEVYAVLQALAEDASSQDEAKTS